MTIESPCINLCRLDPATGQCVGCARTGAEIAAWREFSPQARRSIMARLPARLAAMAPPALAAAER
ncbi:DUF1289 domain-containing protein [Aureimonas populi]|uniref:DUF1289 domain-containing protein n=1 Tax=Aureimonas populi TaxID=1701758 RepID=A0ABW5CM52_9HYPH|nr:DUF1289 domain-containing protein [Aureimonas populi]